MVLSIYEMYTPMAAVNLQRCNHHRQTLIQILCTLIGSVYTLKRLTKQTICFAYKVIVFISFFLFLFVSFTLNSVPFSVGFGYPCQIYAHKRQLLVSTTIHNTIIMTEKTKEKYSREMKAKKTQRKYLTSSNIWNIF